MRTHARQRGAALLTAMIIVTLVASLSASMIWQQWRAIQVETAERARAQSGWMLQGALDYARLILREDSRGGFDDLGEPWAVPLAESRVSTFLAADKDNTDTGPEAFVSGGIVDAQSRYNLRNLIDAQSQVSGDEVAVLSRLCEMVGVAPDVASRIAGGVHEALRAQVGAGGEEAPLMPRTLAQFAWFGIEADALKRLGPYVTVLPVHTRVNINTASREVIAAVVDGLDLGSAERLVQARQRKPFSNIEQVRQLVPDQKADFAKRVSFQSSYFEVQGRLRLDRRVLEQRSLMHRPGANVAVVELRRDRVGGYDAVN